MHLDGQVHDIVGAVDQLGRKAPAGQPRLDDVVPLPARTSRAEVGAQFLGCAEADVLVLWPARRWRADAARGIVEGAFIGLVTNPALGQPPQKRRDSLRDRTKGTVRARCNAGDEGKQRQPGLRRDVIGRPPPSSIRATGRPAGLQVPVRIGA